MGPRQESWEEHTEIVPRVVYARRRRAVMFLVLAAVAFGVGALTLVVPHRHRVERATLDTLTADAQQLAVVLHAALKQTLDRAEGFAGTPVLEAGILTDAATVADIVATEYRLKTRPGETLELFQVRGDSVTSLVRVPAGARPLTLVQGKRVRLENRGGLAVVATAEVAPYNDAADLAGELAVGVGLDLSSLRLARSTVEANLVGAGAPIPLVSTRTPGGPSVTLPIALDAKWQLGPLALHAVPRLSGYHPTWLVALRYVSLGLAVAFLCTFLLGLRRSLTH